MPGPAATGPEAAAVGGATELQLSGERVDGASSSPSISESSLGLGEDAADELDGGAAAGSPWERVAAAAAIASALATVSVAADRTSMVVEGSRSVTVGVGVWSPLLEDKVRRGCTRGQRACGVKQGG